VRREDLEAHVQLVLTGRNAYAQSLRGGVVSPHVWRFVDLTTRLEFLLSGFGWCNMPLHMVQEPIDQGRLKRLELMHGEPPPEFPLYVVCPRDRPLGRAGRWLVADLRERLKSCPASFPPALAAE
jgi:DNA-binding transcriptional LysR family regulator